MTEVPLNKIGLHADPQLCRAFIVHKLGQLDYSALDRWASRKLILYDSSIYADHNDWSDPAGPTQLLTKLVRLGFNPRFDYIVLGGDILRVATVCALVARNWPRFTVLRHDRQLAGYWPFTMDLTSVRAT